MARTLLIVDDIDTNREILKNQLGGDYRIIEAENGKEALELMDSEYSRISAILLDLGMPVMDGYEVLSRMQASERLSQLPVIVTTGQTDAGSEEKALRLGAKDYISKPYKSAIIKQRIRNTINLRETAAAINAMQRDRLTGLYSRDAFFERVSEAVAQHEPGYYMMTCFDIEKFKVINDQYGTQKGDEVLRHIANVFRSGFVPNGGICCRVSSDDFAVLYPVAFSNSETLECMRRDACNIPGIASTIAFSIGRYIVTDVALSPSAMYDRATLTAESVKGRYDATIAGYDESMRDHLIKEQSIVTEMETALKEHQFEVWYQPQYNHSTGALIGSEALVRWRHPSKGLIQPGTFIPVFERNGFIYSLDKYIIEQVCALLRSELDAGRSPLPVSVNISRYDMFCPDIVDVITGLVGKYEIPAEILRLEITESAFANETKHIVAVVKQLIDCGFTLEIDDFGSGYSSLNTLKSVPAQVIKLDMRFFEDDDDVQRSGNIIESVVRMAKWLGMSVIAEGVERRTQADFLRSIGCNYIQGYLYSRPMPEKAYVALCMSGGREEKLLALETVENLDNNSFWNPESMDTLIFNSYVGGACIYEYHQGNVELLRATEKYAQVIGSSRMTVEDVLKLNIVEHLDTENLNRIREDIDRSVKTKAEVTGEYLFLDLPGCPHETYLRSSMRVIAAAGDRYLVYCTNENITAQRMAEQREKMISRQLKSVLDNVACGLTAVRLNGDSVSYILTNNRYYEILGYTEAQYVDEIGNDAYRTVYREDREGVKKTVESVKANGTPVTAVYRAVKRDDGVIWIRSLISMASAADGLTDIQLSTFTDITEQKKAELGLQETTRQLSNMMDDIPGGFVRMKVEPDGAIKPIYFNEGFYKLTGMDYGELMAIYANDALAGVHPDDVNVVRETIELMFKNGEARSSRYRLMHGNGKYIWLTIFGRITKDTEGDTFLNIYYSDATEQMKQEDLQRELLDNLPYGAALYEYDGEKLSVVHLNKRYWELVARREVEYRENAFFDAIYPEDRPVVIREIKSAIRERRDISCDLRIRHGGSGYRPFHIAGRLLHKTDGGYSIYAAYTPISDEAMSLQEMLPIALSAMMDTQTGYTFVKDRNLRYVCCSRELWSLSAKHENGDVSGMSDHDLFDGSLADTFVREDRHVMESGESIVDIVHRMPSRDGTDRYASTSKFPLKDSQGNIIGVYGVGRDVTETRKMQTQLELLTNNIPGGIATYEGTPDALGSIKLTYFSDGLCKLFGYSREEYSTITDNNTLGLVYPEDRDRIYESILALANNNVPMDDVYRARSSDGTAKWIHVKAVMGEPNGDKKTVNAVFADVTEQQEAIQKLRVSEEENRLAVAHSKSVVCRYDIATKILTVPENADSVLGITGTLEDIPYSLIDKGMISPDTAEAYAVFFESIMRGEKRGEAVFQGKMELGWHWLEASFSTIFSNTGKPVSAVISFIDVTDKLEKEAVYEKWQQSIWDKKPDAYSLYRCNVSKESYLDTVKGELLKMRFGTGMFVFDDRTAEYVDKYVCADDKERFAAFLNVDSLLSGYYQGRRIVVLEYREQLDGGKFRWLRLTVDLVEHIHSSDIEAYLLFENIDRMKRLELATIEQAETDPLTGVMNRVTFAAHVNSIIQTSKPNTQYALLMLDIDGFKQVNDTFGHGAGDQALIDIASSIRASLRHEDLVGRLGGDEFLIFLSDIPGDVIAAEKAKKICALARKAFSADVIISGSIGIAVSPRDGADFDTLYKKADTALYNVKDLGKNGYAFYYADIRERNTVDTEVRQQKGSQVKTGKKRRMLIVDDSRIDHAMLTNMFANEYIIEKAKDGNSALVRLRHYGTAISIVLLDLMMPGIDGFDVLKRMQESTELRSIPVIVVSGDDNRETSLRAIREGAVDYVSKPVDSEVLHIRVESAISKAENERLRAKNNILKYQSNEVARYKNALRQSGIILVENDWVAGTFVYDNIISDHIAGTFDNRSLWHILLSDMVAETYTVQKMQELVLAIATDKVRSSEKMLVQLRTPSNKKHWFRMNVYRVMNEFGIAGKVYLTFADIGTERPKDGENN